MNSATILKMVRKMAPISRAQLSKQTGLNPATVSAILGDLIKGHVVKETGIGVSSGGRRPTMLELDSTSYYVIGVDMGTTRVQAGITNLEGVVVHKVSVSFHGKSRSDQIMSIIEEAINQLLLESTLSKERCLGMGMGIHGLVNSEKGISIFAPAFKWSDIPIQAYFEQKYGMPVLIDNDARVMALAEKWFGGAEQLQDFIFMNIGMGVGSGIYTNGQLIKGARFGAGEIGHIYVKDHAKACYCGKTGCLSTVASGPAIAEFVVDAIQAGEFSLLRDRWSHKLENITAKDVHEAATEGDELCIRMLDEAGVYIGKACAVMVNVLNPEMIILGGGVSAAISFFDKGLERQLQQEALPDNLKGVQIKRSKLGQNAGIIGAATLLLQTFFDTPHKYLKNE